MLKAGILKTLRKLGKPAELNEIVKELPWQNIPAETVRRYLLEFEKHYIVSKSSSPPVYMLTKKGIDIVAFVIDLVETHGKTKWQYLATNPYLSELVNLALSLKIIEEKHKTISIITTGCEELSTGLAVKGFICPNDHFAPVQELEWPVYLTCPECGEELKHAGHGIYVPRRMVQESPLEFALPFLLGVVAPIAFGISVIAASELSKK